MSTTGLTLGARVLANGRCHFRVWAPRPRTVELRLAGPHGERERIVPMDALHHGYYEAVLDDVPAGTNYVIRLDGQRDRPDPCSRHQPEGVHGPSQVVDPRFGWTDADWRGVGLERAIFYEVHIGTFTEGGTFDDAVGHVDRLCELGVTMIEVMPVSQFPGARNWGYDGVAPFAVQNSYGGPAGLRRLVNECHRRGMGVAMDVVYNHMGPEGNYLEEFAPYVTEKYRTSWGKALNFDDAWCDEVRRYFIENALMWVDEYHIDALRLDAVHAIFDQSACPFLEELTDAVHERAAQLGREVLVIAESDLNDPKLVRRRNACGWGMDAAWSDDLHHALHALLTGETQGYYRDFGRVEHLARALRDGYVYQNDFSAHRHRRHGAPAGDVAPARHVVCSQNHDQVGNRMKGERLAAMLSLEQLKLAAAIVLLAPFTPLLFMGEEYGETAPFLYFVSHGDARLVEGVRKGRAQEFAAFEWAGPPPDPQDEATFAASKLDHSRRESPGGRALESYYRELIRLRAAHPPIRAQDRAGAEVVHDEQGRTILARRGEPGADSVMIAMNLGDGDRTIRLPDAAPTRWTKLIESADRRWRGPGAAVPDKVQGDTALTLRAQSAALLVRDT